MHGDAVLPSCSHAVDLHGNAPKGEILARSTQLPRKPGCVAFRVREREEIFLLRVRPNSRTVATLLLRRVNKHIRDGLAGVGCAAEPMRPAKKRAEAAIGWKFAFQNTEKCAHPLCQRRPLRASSSRWAGASFTSSPPAGPRPVRPAKPKPAQPTAATW